MKPMKNYLEIKNFSCGYKNGFNLQNIGITLDKGDFGGIIGRNGSGKSTLFKGIIGAIPHQSGYLSLDNIDISTLTIKEKSKRIAIVPQFMELSPISVEEYVLMGRIPYMKPLQFSYTEEDEAIAQKYIKLTGIAHLKDALVTELSGGEQQLVSIATALTQQPTLLLLDEPTSHLDITYQHKVMSVLDMLNKNEGLTILMIVHDLNLASVYCNNLILMKEGAILSQNIPEKIITQDLIDQAYGKIVIIGENPATQKPAVFPLK